MRVSCAPPLRVQLHDPSLLVNLLVCIRQPQQRPKTPAHRLLLTTLQPFCHLQYRNLQWIAFRCAVVRAQCLPHPVHRHHLQPHRALVQQRVNERSLSSSRQLFFLATASFFETAFFFAAAFLAAFFFAAARLCCSVPEPVPVSPPSCLIVSSSAIP